MISHKTRTAIQSAAYERPRLMYEQSDDWTTLGVSVANLLDDTDRSIRAAMFDAQAFLHELNSTRWRRLQNTQFVYWAVRNGHPRIEHENGTHSYLQAHRAVYHIEADSNVRDLMEHHEQQLFHTLDEAVVYWRGWQVFEEQNTESLIFTCEYCTAHIWNDKVHEIMREPVRQGKLSDDVARLIRTEQRTRVMPRLLSKEQQALADIKAQQIQSDF